MVLTVQDEIRALTLLESHYAKAQAEADSIKKMISDAEQRVIEALADSGTDSITVDGRSYKVDVVPLFSPCAGMADLAVKWITENGGEDLVKPSMHHKRRDAFLKEVLLDDDGEWSIPEDLIGIVDVFEKPRLIKRKAR